MTMPHPPQTHSFMIPRVLMPCCAAALLMTSLTFATAAPPWNFANQSPTWPPPTGYLPTQYSIPLEASAVGGAIRLRFFEPNTYTIFRKNEGTTAWGNAIATGVVATAGSTWTDTTVVEGQMYDYRATTTTGALRAGWVTAGVKVDQTLPRGRLALVVSNDIPVKLADEYAQYKADLISEGWFIHEIVTPRAPDYLSNGTGPADSYGIPTAPFANAHVLIRNQIIALHNQYPGQLKNVVLLGKVPVPRSGHYLSGPDGHGNRAAVGADAYYAEMDGVWPDNLSNAPFSVDNGEVTGFINNPDGSVTFPPDMVPFMNGSTPYAAEDIKDKRLEGGGPHIIEYYQPYIITVNDGLLTKIEVSALFWSIVSVANGRVNVPGDNKFDWEYLSGTGGNKSVELGFGRIDFSNNVPGEYEAMRMYFNKLHRYKTASPDFQAGRRAVHRVLYDQVAVNALLSMPGVVGMNSLDFTRTTDLPVLANADFDRDAAYSAESGPYLFYFKGNSTPSESTGAKAVFWTGLQSNWGYWFEPVVSSNQNAMQRRLAEDSYILSYTWSIFDSFYLYQRMGLGFDAGDMMRVSISDKTWAAGYQPRITTNYGSGNDGSQALFMNHMGCPTLRLFMFAPPTGLSVVSAGGHPNLSWTASANPPPGEPAILGYHIYRSATQEGPFVRLTTAPIAGTTYADLSVTTGAWHYLVRAVRLEPTGAGSYYNASLGASGSIDLTNGPSPLQVSTSSLAPASWKTDYQATLKAAGGTPVYTWSVVNGALPPGLGLTDAGVISGLPTAAGTYGFTVRATDQLGQFSEQVLSIAVESNKIANFFAEANTFITGYSSTRWGFTNPALLLSGPVYLYQPFLRFDLSGFVSNNSFVRAKLILTLEGNTQPNSNASVLVALTQDAGQNWTESAIVWATRPLDDVSLAHARATAFPSAFGTLEFDITDMVKKTLSEDPAKKLGLRLYTNWGNAFENEVRISSRYASGAARPKVVIETTDAPAITIQSPTINPASLHVGSSLVIEATAAAIPAQASGLTVSWSKQSGPGQVLFSSPTTASTNVSFSEVGDYVLRLTAQDGVLSSTKDLVVRVLAVPLATAAAYGPSQGLIVRLPFDEGSGTSTADVSGVTPANPGILRTIGATGVPTWVNTGRIGKALNFDGAGQRVEIDDSTAKPLDGMQKLSASLWVKLNAADANAHAILVKRTSSTASTTSYALTINSAEKLSMSVANKTAVVGDNILAVGQWYHVVMVFDGSLSSNNLRLYLNGSPEKFGTTITGQPDNKIPRNPTSKLRVGDFTASAVTASFNGQIDEVRLYDRVLTLEEIQDLAGGAPANMGPQILLGGPVGGNVGEPIALGAAVSDDGLPGSLQLQWSLASGPQAVSFADATAASTTVTANAGGDYSLRLVASDGSITTWKDLLAVVTGSSLNAGYLSWLEANSLPADGSGLGAPNASASGDGIANAVKYALGLDADSSGYAGRLSSGMVEEGGQDYLSLTYQCPDPALTGVGYLVKVGGDLTAWSPDVTVVSESITAGLKTITVRDNQPIDPTHPKRFIRLEVNLQ